MVVTESFVYLHQPKTGVTSVETMVRQLYDTLRPPLPLRLFHRARGLPTCWFRSMHKDAGRDAVPSRFRGLPILATVRNPYDRYLSSHEFGRWREHPEWWGDLGTLGRRISNYPGLSFEEFVRLSCRYRIPSGEPRGVSDDRLGFQSARFVSHVCCGGVEVWHGLAEGRLSIADVRDNVRPIHFLLTLRLDTDLYGALVALGLPADRAAFILLHPPIYPPEGGRKDDRTWEAYHTPGLRAFVRRREALLFELFPEFDS